MFTLVSYDISDDKRRLKIMKTLQDFGKRVQYSVFECNLKPVELERLKNRLTPLVKKNEDSIRFYFIGADDVSRIQVIGIGQVTRDEPYKIY